MKKFRFLSIRRFYFDRKEKIGKKLFIFFLLFFVAVSFLFRQANADFNRVFVHSYGRLILYFAYSSFQGV
jgi:hypothetical protein